MSREIERAVDKVLEQSFDQVDWGRASDKSPSPDAPDDDEFQDDEDELSDEEYFDLPYPQGAETQWFGVFHCFSRMDQWHKRVSVVLDTEDPLAAGAVLLDLAYFRRQAQTRADLEAWKVGGEPVFSYPEICRDPAVVAQRDGDNAVALIGSEWNGGVARTREDAERMYVASEPGDDDGEWEEL